MICIINVQAAPWQEVNESFFNVVKSDNMQKSLYDYYDTTTTQKCYFDFGFELMQDPYNKKCYIYDVQNKSLTNKLGINIGNEILKINGVKAKKYNIDEINEILGRINNLEVEVKTNLGKKILSLSKENFCTTSIEEPELFTMYWKQIYQNDLPRIIKLTAVLSGLPLSYWAKRDLEEGLLDVEYWKGKHNQFKNGYNSCVATQENLDIHVCLNQLVNRELMQINKDNIIKQQQAALRAQQQMQQQQINAMNNYSDALRNQHVKIEGSVYNYGSVDVNHNINGNINSNVYYHW